MYGSGYAEDIDNNTYKNRDKESHTEAAILQLEKIINLYEIALMSLELQKRDSILGKIPTFNNQINNFLKF